MSRFTARTISIVTGIGGGCLAFPRNLHAQTVLDSLHSAPYNGSETTGPDLLLEGWHDFSNIWTLLNICNVLLIALFLGAIIAYHPSTRRRISSLAHLEQPKTFLMYAMVAAVAALLVKVRTDLAFTVFGIGGLMRFRTDVGEAKDTGRVILVTMVGLCCGLKIFIVAVPATVIGWIVIYFLERQVTGVVRISGIRDSNLPRAAAVYQQIIQNTGCTIVGDQSKLNKKQLVFVLQVRSNFNRAVLENAFSQVEPEIRGKVDWERL